MGGFRDQGWSWIGLGIGGISGFRDWGWRWVGLGIGGGDGWV